MKVRGFIEKAHQKAQKADFFARYHHFDFADNADTHVPYLYSAAFALFCRDVRRFCSHFGAGGAAYRQRRQQPRLQAGVDYSRFDIPAFRRNVVSLFRQRQARAEDRAANIR